MKYEVKKAMFGDQIRVNRGLYYHHGIYVDDEHVIEFGSPTNELDPNTAVVMETTLLKFLKGGVLECASYDESDLKKKRNSQDVVNYAYSKIGTKGYDIINYNCEHFSNECAFGEKKSSQVESVMSLFGALFNSGKGGL